MTPETRCNVPSSHVPQSRRSLRVFLFSPKWRMRPMHISSLASVTPEVMNNTSFIILLQEICNTWNRMQYAVYLHAERTQGASLVSVCVIRREEGGKKRGQQRKRASVTPDSPSASRANYSPVWGAGCMRSWWPSRLSTQLDRECVISNMPARLVILFNSPYVNSSLCWHTQGINVGGQNPCKLLWQLGCQTSRIVPPYLVTRGNSTSHGRLQ